jgi:sugar phosphate isomerase/epimerase
MTKKSTLDRRSFVATSLAATAFSVLPITGAQAQPEAAEKASDEHPLCLFAKHLQLMPWPELAKFCRELDVDGIEATVRNGGQVQPEHVADKLPELVETLGTTDSRVVIMTTDINGPGSKHSETVLRTAALLGVTHYRMSYYKYDFSKKILPQLEEFAKQASELAAMNHELGIVGLYQNHAGANYVGGPLWDLAQVLESIPVSDIAVAYDVRHATVEGNLSWPIDLAMIRDKIGAVFVKDYRTIDGKTTNVPLGEGDVSLALFKSLRESRPVGPVSLHMEYYSHTDPSLVAASAEAFRKDRQAIRQLLGL